MHSPTNSYVSSFCQPHSCTMWYSHSNNIFVATIFAFTFFLLESKRHVLQEIQDSILRKRNEMRTSNPFITIQGIRQWFIIHLLKAILGLFLLTLVPSPFTIITYVLWAALVCYWLRNFTAYLVEISQLFGIENNYRDIRNYLGRYKDSPVPGDVRYSHANGRHAALVIN